MATSKSTTAPAYPSSVVSTPMGDARVTAFDDNKAFVDSAGVSVGDNLYEISLHCAKDSKGRWQLMFSNTPEEESYSHILDVDTMAPAQQHVSTHIVDSFLETLSVWERENPDMLAAATKVARWYSQQARKKERGKILSDTKSVEVESAQPVKPANKPRKR